MTISLVENVQIAVRALASKKLRSSLTMLGMIIGNASVIAMIAVGQGAQRFVTQQFEGLGTNIIFVFPGLQRRSNVASAVQADNLTIADAEAIARDVVSVSNLTVERSSRLRLTQGSADTQVNVTGTTPSYTQVRNTEVTRGRFLSPVDMQNQSRVAILGHETALTLFGSQDPIGRRIRIKNIGFEVVGVMQERGASFGQNLDNAAYIPFPVMIDQLTGRKSTQSSPTVSLIAISTQNLQQASEAEFQITNLLRLRHNILQGDDDFRVRTQQDLLVAANNVTQILTLVLGATAGISLLVGGVGITNIMLVSVTERTREIGLRKAIGATRSDILLQFAIEAIILSTIGGLVGITVGVVGILGIAAITPLEAIISPTAVGIAVAVSGSIGLVFGVVPARNAARLDPIVALRM